MWLSLLAGMVLVSSLIVSAQAQSLEFAEFDGQTGNFTLVFDRPVGVYDLFLGKIEVTDGHNSVPLSSANFVYTRDEQIFFDVSGGILDSLNMTRLQVVYTEYQFSTGPVAIPSQQADIRHVIRVGLVAPPGGEIEAMARLAVDDLNRMVANESPPLIVKLSVWDDDDPVVSLLHLDDAGINVVVGAGSILDAQEDVGSDMIVIACCTTYHEKAVLALQNSFALVPGHTDGLPAILSLMSDRGVDRVIPVYVDDTAGRVLADQITRGAYSVVEEGVVYDRGSPNNAAIRLSEKLVDILLENPDSQPGILLTDPSWAPALLDVASDYNTLLLAQWFGLSEHILHDGSGSEFAADVEYSVPAIGAPDGAQSVILAARIHDTVGSWPASGTYSVYDAIRLAVISQLDSDESSGISGPTVHDIRDGVQQLAGISGYLGLDSQGGLASPMHDMLTVRGGQWIKTAVYNPPSTELVGMRSITGVPVDSYAYGPGDGRIHSVSPLGLLVDGYDTATALVAVHLGIAAYQALPLVEVLVQDSGTNAHTMQQFENMGVRLVVAHTTEEATAEAAAYSDDITILGTASVSDSLAIPADNLFRLAPPATRLAEAISATLVEDNVFAVSVLYPPDQMPLLDTLNSTFPGVLDAVPYDMDMNPDVLSSRIITSVRHLTGEHGQSPTGVLAIGSNATYPLSLVADTTLDRYRWYIAAAPIPFGIDLEKYSDFSLTGISAAISDGGPAQLRYMPLTSLYGDILVQELAVQEAGRIGTQTLEATRSATGSILKELIRAALPDIASTSGLVIDDATLDVNGDLAVGSYDLWVARGDSWIRERLYIPSIGHVDRVVVGMVAPLTGWQSKYGLMQVHAAHMAISEYNKGLAEGDNLWRLAITIQDTAGDINRAAGALDSLHNMDIDTVLGPSGSAVLDHIAPLAVRYNMTLFSCCSDWSGSFTDMVFRMSPGHDVQLRALVAMMHADSIEGLVVLYPDDKFGSELAVKITNIFNGTIKHYGYAAGDSPGDALSEAARGAAILAGGRSGSVGVLVADFENTDSIIADAGLYPGLENARWYGISRDGILPVLPRGSIAEISAENVGFTVAAQTTAIDAPSLAQYVRSATGFEPYIGVFSIYDSAMLLAQAVEGADTSTDASRLARILPLAAVDVQGLVGDNTLNQKGDLANGLYAIYTIDSGTWQVTYTYDTLNNMLERNR